MPKTIKFDANPHFYDYIHSFKLVPNKDSSNEGIIKLCDVEDKLLILMPKGNINGSKMIKKVKL